MSDVAIKVEGLSKQYILHHQQAGTLRDTLALAWKQGLKAFSGRETFWALDNVSFEVPHGQVLGIIGRNGTGKSTLLKILSRITPPTKGRVELDGRVASLLEVGTGFHPELTGRENIFLNGSILGMSRAEIRRKFDEIVAFSGVERFLDTPVKHYSSGMYVRLAFSVAAHLEAEILLLDEVLAVGDAEFQRKCLGKVDNIARSGKTVVLVTHNMGYINQICSRAILMDGGIINTWGKPVEVISAYNNLDYKPPSGFPFNGPLKNRVKFDGIRINGLDPFSQRVILPPVSPINIQVFLNVSNLKPFRVTLSIFRDGCRLFSLHDSYAQNKISGKIECGYKIPQKLLRPGQYEIAIGGLEKNEYGDWFWNRYICSFSITEEWDRDFESINHGMINIKSYTYRKINDS